MTISILCVFCFVGGWDCHHSAYETHQEEQIFLEKIMSFLSDQLSLRWPWGIQMKMFKCLAGNV